MAFDGKVVVVTGVGERGQAGEAIARAFGTSGASVVAIGRRREVVEARAAELREDGCTVRAIGCDLADAAQVEAMARSVAESSGGRIDALVNAAGGFAMTGPVVESDTSAWSHQFAINLTTAYLATRALLPLLRRSRGAIVYFTSAAALPGASVKHMAAYVAAKSGVIALMRAVAQEEQDTGVRANAIAPTAIRTTANVAAMGDRVPYVERDEVANTVMFLCSAAASAVTGQVVELRGRRAELRGESGSGGP